MSLLGTAPSLLVALLALQVGGGGGQCCRLLADMAGALRREGGGGGGGAGGGTAWGLRLWLPASQLQARTTIALHPYRNVLEVQGFPAYLDVGFRGDSPMNSLVVFGKTLPGEEVPIEGSTILRDLQLMEDGSLPPGHVVVRAPAHALLARLAVVARNRSGACCQLPLPAGGEATSPLLPRLISQLAARHVLLNSQLRPRCSVVAARLGPWLAPQHQPQPLAPPPPPPPPPVQPRACLPQLDGGLAYCRNVFAIIREAMSQLLTARAAAAMGSADGQPRQQLPAPAVPPPSLLHRRARRSYVIYPDEIRFPVVISHEDSGQPPQQMHETDRGPAKTNYNSPPPIQVIADNRLVQVTQPPTRWPFYPGPSPPPRYVWRDNTWVETVYDNGNWRVPTSSRSLNHQGGRHLLYVLVIDVWVLITSDDILWDKAKNSFYHPQQLLQYQPNSAPTYVWVNDKLVEVVNTHNQWVEASPGQVNKRPTDSQNGDQVACVWDSKNWVLCKLLDLLATGDQADQHKKPPGPPSSVEHKEVSKLPPPQVEKTTVNVPFPGPSGSYKLERLPSGHPSSGSQNSGWNWNPVY